MLTIDNLKDFEQLSTSRTISTSANSETLEDKKDEVLPLQVSYQSLDSEVSQLISERNQLFTQLADLKQILRRLGKEATAESKANSKALKSLKAKADSLKSALHIAEEHTAHMSNIAELWGTLELS